MRHSVFRVVSMWLAFMASLIFLWQAAYAQTSGSPTNFSVGDAVTTGFSGVVAPDPAKPLPADKSAIDLTFIDLDGASAEVADVAHPGHAWDASLLPTPPKFRVTASQVGQVFGVAVGDAPRPDVSPNIYLSATSLFGLQITHRLADGSLERLKTGAPDAQWAPGQFGPGPQGGPGSLYVVNGATGAVTPLANVSLDGAPNPGPGLGNLAYDSTRKQLFVSDLYTGMIHRIGLDGADLGHFDHGVNVRPTAQLPAMTFDPHFRMNIASPGFDASNPDSWGFAPPARQVWAVTVHEQRLYYSVLEGPQIWSVGLQANGDFGSDARLEVNIPGQSSPLAVTDIAFSAQGAMVVSERNAIGNGFYDYTAFTKTGAPRVLRFWQKKPTDPPSPGLWNPVSEEVPVGFFGDFRNTDGGVAFGYGYDQSYAISPAACGGSLLITGEKLRDEPALADRLAAGGPLFVDGLQISPPDLARDPKTPEPWASYFFDYDGLFADDTANSGHQGSVRTFTAPCGGEPMPLAQGAQTPFVFGGGPDCQGNDCGCEGRDCEHRGVLIVKKIVVDHSPLPVPPGTTFPIHVGCGGFVANMALPDGGMGTVNNIPYLTNCTVTEAPLGAGYDFCPRGWTPVWTQNIASSPVQITAPVTVVTVTNTLTCDGRVIIKKEVENRSEAVIPASTTYPITLDCNGVTTNVALPDSGSATIANVPDPSTCIVSEPALGAAYNFCPKGWTTVWTTPPLVSPSNPVPINAPVTVITVTNILHCKREIGDLTVEKKVQNHSPLPIPATTTYPIEVTCGGVLTNMALTDGGTQTVSNLPIGTNCTVTETLPTMNFCPKGDIPVWSQQFAPGSVSITGTTNAYTVVNILDCKHRIGGDVLTITKRVEDRSQFPVSPSTTYPISVDCGGATTSMTLTNGASQTVTNITPGASCTVSETPPTASVCPPGLAPHWTTTYSPSSTVTVPPTASVLVLNVLICEQPHVCVKPMVMNAAGECMCPPPSAPGPILNQCICPQGQQMLDGACVPITQVCKPPLVMNAAHECVCPLGTNLQNGACVGNPLVCKPPLVPNSEGACVCQPGTHWQNGACIKNPVVCKPPMAPDARGGCMCPAGTENVNGACVKIVKTCRPPLVMNDAGQCVAVPVKCGVNMVPNGAGGCACRPGLALARGICQALSPAPKPTRFCAPPARLNNQGQCETPLRPGPDRVPRQAPPRSTPEVPQG